MRPLLKNKIKYTNPANGILDFCWSKSSGPSYFVEETPSKHYPNYESSDCFHIQAQDVLKIEIEIQNQIQIQIQKNMKLTKLKRPPLTGGA